MRSQLPRHRLRPGRYLAKAHDEPLHLPTSAMPCRRIVLAVPKSSFEKWSPCGAIGEPWGWAAVAPLSCLRILFADRPRKLEQTLAFQCPAWPIRRQRSFWRYDATLSGGASKPHYRLSYETGRINRKLGDLPSWSRWGLYVRCDQHNAVAEDIPEPGAARPCVLGSGRSSVSNRFGTPCSPNVKIYRKINLC